MKSTKRTGSAHYPDRLESIKKDAFAHSSHAEANKMHGMPAHSALAPDREYQGEEDSENASCEY